MLKSIIIKSLLLLQLTNINPTITSTVDTNKTYNYYGIVNNNTVYLKVNDNWQQYTIQTDYIGYTCKLITMDHQLTTDNYKTISILNIQDINNADTIQVNQAINAWNNCIK